jgi:monoamine oxidase
VVTTCDVVVIGAGVSGLVCASRLAAAGLTVTVCEARQRVGGRVRTFRPADGGPPIELGAQVVHGDRNPVARHVPHGALRRVVPGTARVVLGGRVQPMGVLGRAGHPPWTLDRMLVAAAGTLGDASIGQWLGTLSLGGSEQRASREWYRQTWAAPVHRLGARGVAAAMGGDLAMAGAGEYTLADGFDRLTAGLADGVEVRLGTPITEVTWRPGRVVVRAPHLSVTAAAVVMTVPPALVAAGRPRVNEMPPAKRAAAGALAPGDGCCVVVTMTEPAPETAVVFDADGGCGFVSCHAERPEVLIVAKAAAADRLRARLAHAGALPAMLATTLPWAACAAVAHTDTADWGRDPWSGGAFSFPRTGATWAPAVWAEPVRQTVFFAGEATALGRCSPFVHGALASGLRVADQVLEALR